MLIAGVALLGAHTRSCPGAAGSSQSPSIRRISCTRVKSSKRASRLNLPSWMSSLSTPLSTLVTSLTQLGISPPVVSVPPPASERNRCGSMNAMLLIRSVIAGSTGVPGRSGAPLLVGIGSPLLLLLLLADDVVLPTQAEPTHSSPGPRS